MTTTPETPERDPWSEARVIVGNAFGCGPMHGAVADAVRWMDEAGLLNTGTVTSPQCTSASDTEESETPALPGDLTDETIERAARALYETEPAKHGRERLGWDEISKIAQKLFVDRARAVLAAARVAPEVDGSTSDGHHAFDELYAYRMAYHAHAAAGWLAAGIPVVKSRRHSDGELCFGGGWFIVVADLPTGQVSNHYREEHWALFDVPEVALPPEYDGHTPDDALQRLLAARVAPAPDNGRCGGCRDLGPHRNVPGCGYYEPEPAPVTPSREERIEAATWALLNGDTDVTDRGVSDSHYRERRAEVEMIAPILAPVTPSEPEWEHGTAEGEVLLARIMDALAYLHCKSMNPKADSPIMGYRAMSEDQREFLRECQRGAAEQIMRTWSAEATPAPSPDREKLVEQRREVLRREFGYRIRTAVAYGAMKGYRELPSQARADFIQNEIAFAVSDSEGKLAALAVPPVVNEAKLAKILAQHRVTAGVPGQPIECLCGWRSSLRDPSHPAHVAAVLVERQRDWLGESG